MIVWHITTPGLAKREKKMRRGEINEKLEGEMLKGKTRRGQVCDAEGNTEEEM